MRSRTATALCDPRRVLSGGLAGRAIAELAIHGRATTLDLILLSAARLRPGNLILEDAIV